MAIIIKRQSVDDGGEDRAKVLSEVQRMITAAGATMQMQMVGCSVLAAIMQASTEKCRFLDKRVREITRFFVAPQRMFFLSVHARASTHRFIHKYLQLSTMSVIGNLNA